MDPAASVRALFPGHYLRKFLDEGIRPDARGFADVRKTACTSGVISTADGSASVQLGNTSVIAGVNLSPFSPPAIGSPAGRLMVVVDLGQMGLRQSAGRTEDQAMALSDFVARSLRQTNVLNDDDLIIQKGTPAAAWAVTLTITCLNFDGNILDAVLLVAVAALQDTRIPAVELSESGVVVECDKPAKALTLRVLPVCLTLALFENIESGKTDMIVDPTAEEERLSHGTITVVVAHAATGKSKVSVADAPIMVHKAGGLPVSSSCLQHAIQHARQRSLGTLALLTATS